jgi:uncharacterized membrane protein
MEFRHKLPPLEELRMAKLVDRNIGREVRQSLSGSQRFALFMTRKIGSLGFFLFLVGWTVVWLGWNIWGPVAYRFDPAPAFVIWLFASNILQLVLLPLILVGQNVEAKAADKRSQMDFEINKKSEKEIAVVIAHLENQNELLLEILRKVERH